MAAYGKGRKFWVAAVLGAALFAVTTVAMGACFIDPEIKQNAFDMGFRWWVFGAGYLLCCVLALGYQGWNVVQKAMVAKFSALRVTAG